MNMKTFWAVIIAVILVLVAAWALDFDMAGDFEAPEIRADVVGGEVPEVDVETADIEVEEKSAQVEVPDVDVEMEEREFTYPDIDIESPEENTMPEEDDL